MWRFPRLARMSSRRSSQPSRRPLFRPTVEALEARRVMTSLLPTPGDDSYSTPINTILQVAAPGVMVNDTPTPDLVPVILDATRIDIESLLLAGAPAVRSAEDDLNGDGLPDLVVHVRVQDSALFALYDGSLDSELKQTVEISLTCETVDDVMLEGLESLDILLAGKYRRELLYDLAASGAV